MQVFLPYKEPIEVAKCLDRRRLWKQVLEGQQITEAIDGSSTSWRNHPVVKMYKNNLQFVRSYYLCLWQYHMGNIKGALLMNEYANASRPDFITEDFCIQHRRRLYTKDKVFYKDFAKYGESDENWYIVDGKLLKYKNGKLINK